MNNTQKETVAVVVRVKEMNEDGLAVLRRGEGRQCKVKVYFPNARVHKWYPIRKIEMVLDKDGKPQRIVKQPKEYVSMWSRFLNYFGLKNNKPSVS